MYAQTDTYTHTHTHTPSSYGVFPECDSFKALCEKLVVIISWSILYQHFLREMHHWIRFERSGSLPGGRWSSSSTTGMKKPPLANMLCFTWRNAGLALINWTKALKPTSWHMCSYGESSWKEVPGNHKFIQKEVTKTELIHLEDFRRLSGAHCSLSESKFRFENWDFRGFKTLIVEL